MKQTAVEWLKKILDGQKDKPFDYDEWCIAFDHAKEMEKEQIKEAWLNSLTKGDYNSAEQYYTETYESKTNL
jgi:hypothetical protein